MLSSPQLRQLLDYDPATGVFLWNSRSNVTGPEKCWNTRFAGKPAGRINSRGYHEIVIFGKLYGAQRLAWLYVTGDWPQDLIDHRDRDKANNVFTNLREATNSQNGCNRSKTCKNTSGFKGVYLYKADGRQYYTGQVQIEGRRISIGYHPTPEVAHQAYAEAAKLHHGKFAHTS